MSDKTLKVSSWNIRGLGDLFRGKCLRRWSKRFHKDLDVLCIQEIKAQCEQVEFQFNTLFPLCNYIVDYSREGWVGTAILSLPHCKVTDQGTRGDGTLAWCTIDTKVGPVSIASVYAPNSRASRIELWNWMCMNLHEGN